MTIYLPGDRAGLYPPQLAEGAASLLPDGPRPAVVFTVRVAPDGSVRLAGAERSVIRNRAKLAYSTVTLAELPVGIHRTGGADRTGRAGPRRRPGRSS